MTNDNVSISRRGRRPRAGEAADVRVMLRLTPDEFTLIEGAAAAREVSVSEFVRASALRVARRHS